MPKELTHWIIAERTREELTRGRIADAVDSYPHHYYLGAIVYDSPFYAVFYKNSEHAAEIATELHGIRGEDTYGPFRRLISYFGDNPPAPVLSFFAGGITHLFGDVNFHPLVNYFCGKYNDSDKHRRINSQARHRDFESCMDLYFLVNFEKELINNGRLSATLAGLIDSKTDVEKMAGIFYEDNPQPEPDSIWKLFRRHAFAQGLFGNSSMRNLFSFLSAASNGPLDTFRALFYPDSEQGFPFFQSPIEYTHPHTGEKISASGDRIMAAATNAAARMLNGFQKGISGGTSPDYFTCIKGLSLDAGCDTSVYPEAAYSDLTRPIIDLCRGL